MFFTPMSSEQIETENEGLPFGPVIDLIDLDGENGFVLTGENNDKSFGIAVSGAGDVNGDGINDMIVGARTASTENNSRAGKSYVVFGTATGFPSNLSVSTLNGDNGFTIKGANAANFAGSVSDAGDVNGDGIDDLIVGASGVDTNNEDAGASYVIFGSQAGFDRELELADIENGDGSTGFVLNGIDDTDYSGVAVSGAGDVNGDGFDDVIIGALTARLSDDFRGESYIVFGTASGFGGQLNLSRLDGDNGFTFKGKGLYDFAGRSVSGAGDINGDGFDDVIIGAPYNAQYGYGYNYDNAGRSYLILGAANGFASELTLSDLNGNNGFVINGVNDYDNFGTSVSGAGDINGDGLADIIVGATSAGNTSKGRSYVVFGKATGFDERLDLNSLNGENGFVVTGIENTVGGSVGAAVSAAGDVNNDGIDDLIIGAPRVGSDNISRATGESYVLFGQTTGFERSFSLSDLNGDNGFRINAIIDQLIMVGTDVSNLGDVNGDGVDDVIVGSRSDAFDQRGPGKSYVIFGRKKQPAAPSISDTPTPGDDVLIGTRQADDIDGRAGNDQIEGKNGDDTLLGGFGRDVLVGGNGRDFLDGQGGSDHVEGGNGRDTIMGGSGQDVLSGGAGNDLISGDIGNDTLLGGDGRDFLEGGSGRDQLLGGLGNDVLTGGAGKDVFVLAIGEGKEQVTDFERGRDKIGLSGGLSFGSLTFNRSNVVAAETNEVLARLQGVDATALTAADFVAV